MEKQEIRKLNYVSILSAIYTIAKGDYKDIPISEYEKIPHNDRKLFDLKIVGVNYNLLGNNYTIDIGINHFEVDNEDNSDFYNVSRIIDQGDLSTYYGYSKLDASGYTIIEGKVLPDTLKDVDDLSKLEVFKLLKEGYTYIKMKTLPVDINDTSFLMNIISEEYEVPKLNLGPGSNPTFLLQKNGVNEYAIINGFLINLKTKESNFKNALIYR